MGAADIHFDNNTISALFQVGRARSIKFRE